MGKWPQVPPDPFLPCTPYMEVPYDDSIARKTLPIPSRSQARYGDRLAAPREPRAPPETMRGLLRSSIPPTEISFRRLPFRSDERRVVPSVDSQRSVLPTLCCIRNTSVAPAGSGSQEPPAGAIHVCSGPGAHIIRIRTHFSS